MLQHMAQRDRIETRCLPGEQLDAAQACLESPLPGDFYCLFIRIDAHGLPAGINGIAQIVAVATTDIQQALIRAGPGQKTEFRIAFLPPQRRQPRHPDSQRARRLAPGAETRIHIAMGQCQLQPAQATRRTLFFAGATGGMGVVNVINLADTGFVWPRIKIGARAARAAIEVPAPRRRIEQVVDQAPCSNSRSTLTQAGQAARCSSSPAGHGVSQVGWTAFACLLSGMLLSVPLRERRTVPQRRTTRPSRKIQR